jgi:NAD(P)H-hydrate epimerase
LSALKGVWAVYLSREQVRSLDRLAIEDYGVPGIVLMENAGRGAVEVLVSFGVQGPVVIGCGKGNNGGDGLVMARHLDNRGVPVRVLLFARPEELSGDAALAFRPVSRSGIPLTAYPPDDLDWKALHGELSGAEWIVDALYGTGLQGPIRPPLDQVVEAINASKRRILAVDLPSGLDCDTGRPLGATIKATHTATLVARKKGFAQPEAQPWLGQVHVVEIGVPRVLIEQVLSH